MFKYKISKEIFKPELGYVSSSFFISKDDKEVVEKLKFISNNPNLEKIKSQVVEAWQKRKEEIENTGLEEAEMLPVIYSPFLVRVPLFDPQNPPEEMQFLEIEYYPFHPLLAEFEKKAGRRFPIDIDETIRIGRTGNKRILFKYEKEKGWKPLFTTTRENLFPFLEALFELSKQWRNC